MGILGSIFSPQGIGTIGQVITGLLEMFLGPKQAAQGEHEMMMQIINDFPKMYETITNALPPALTPRYQRDKSGKVTGIMPPMIPLPGTHEFAFFQGNPTAYQSWALGQQPTPLGQAPPSMFGSFLNQMNQQPSGTAVVHGAGDSPLAPNTPSPLTGGNSQQSQLLQLARQGDLLRRKKFGLT